MSPEAATGGVDGARRVRISVIGLLIVSLFLALAVRLVDLQVLDGAELAAAADANKVRTVYEEAPRGRILDRNGAVLVANREVDVLTVDREAVARDDTLLPRLATFLSTTAEVLQERINDTRSSLYKPAIIASGVDKSVIASFRERAADFVGANAETQVERWYPHGPMAAHVLGYVGEINDDEMAKRSEDGYQLGDDIGKSGLEQAWEDRLRGRAGIDKIEVNARGEAVRVLERIAPVPGQDLKTSLDLDTQRAAQDALAEGLRTARGGDDPKANPATPAPAGAVVAIDPENGSVRAMASFPTYDPAAFVNGISQADYAALTSADSALPLNNRAIGGQYAPGSTFKLVTAIAALRSGVTTADTILIDRGSFTLGNRRYQNAQGAVFGAVDLRKALSVSSDVYFYDLGAKFWDRRAQLGDPMQDVAREFGLGKTQGIGVPGETPGRVPDATTRAAMHDANPEAFPERNWYGGDNVNVAIGQGDTLTTPLQLANLYATFANGGTVYKPRLVEAVVDSTGKALTSFAPEVITKVDLPAAIYGPVRDGLIGAVEQPGGTAANAFKGFDFAQFPVAGKTGTAQVTGKQDSALFAGYGPVGKANTAVSVVLEEAGFGGAVAAPVARSVFSVVAGQAQAPIAVVEGSD